MIEYEDHSTERLGLNTLELDLENPRFPRTASQEEAIGSMLERIPNKILAMAKSIAEGGLNPSTLPIVFATEDGRHIVKDGNRRVTAMKLLMNPKLAKDADVRRKFEKIKFDRADLKYVECVVFYDEGAADRWVELNHQSNHSGEAHEDWDPIPKMRDARNHGISVPVLDMFEMAQKAEPSIDESLSISTLDRIVSSKHFKELTGWRLDGDQLIFNMPEGDFIKCLVEIALDIADKDRSDHIDSRGTNKSEEIAAYLSKKKEEGLFGNVGTPSSVPIIVGGRGGKRGGTKKTKKPTSTLILKDVDWSVDSPRIMDLLDEMKLLSVNAHPNVISVVFRAFMEMFTKWFCDHNDMKCGMHLDQRMKDIAKFLYNEGEIKDDCRRATKEILERMDNAYNFNEELNQFGHNYELNPTPDSLISVFNSVRCLLNGMFAYDMKKAGQRRQIYGHATDVQLCSSAPLCAIRAAKAASPATCRR